MYLGKSKRRLRYSIVHELGQGDLSNQIPPAELPALITKLKAGDISAREKIILGHMRLTLQISAGYAGRYPKKKDDIVSAAMLGLVDAVNRARTVFNNGHIAAYITSTVHSHIFKFLLKDRLVTIPEKRLRDLAKENLVPYTFTINNKPSDDEENLEYTNDAEASVLPPFYDDHEDLVVDFINHLTPQQQRVLEGRLNGQNDVEIARDMGLTKARVGQVRIQIQEIFLKWRTYHEA